MTNIPVLETINYIIEQIYLHNKITPICSKLIFKRLLLKVATGFKFIYACSLNRQIDDSTMGGTSSVRFSRIYMAKMENEVVNH